MKYFTIEELTRSDAARRLGIANTAPPEAVANLERLVAEVLDPLREAWGGPVHVNSGYRCQALNRAVGGAPRSQHMRGLAADVTVGSPAANHRLRALAIKLRLPYDQLIDEQHCAWLHISIAEAGQRPRGQNFKLRARN